MRHSAYGVWCSAKSGGKIPLPLSWRRICRHIGKREKPGDGVGIVLNIRNFQSYTIKGMAPILTLSWKSLLENKGVRSLTYHLSIFCICTVAALPHVKCTRTYHKLGCYKKVSSSSNPWQLLITDRSDSPDGYLLDWRKWEESIHRYVCEFCIKTSYTKYRNCGILVFVNIGDQLVSKRLLNCSADESKIWNSAIVWKLRITRGRPLTEVEGA